MISIKYLTPPEISLRMSEVSIQVSNFLVHSTFYNMVYLYSLIMSFLSGSKINDLN